MAVAAIGLALIAVGAWVNARGSRTHRIEQWLLGLALVLVGAALVGRGLAG